MEGQGKGEHKGNKVEQMMLCAQEMKRKEQLVRDLKQMQEEEEAERGKVKQLGG